MAMNAPSQRVIPTHRGHVFRSELVEAVARIERWTLHLLQKSVDPKATGKQAKIPQFVTQRVKRVKDLAASHPDLVRSWPETIILLEDLERFWNLRTDVVHATLAATIDKHGTAYFTFESTATGGQSNWERRKTFSEAELSPLIREAGQLIDRLSKQLRD